MYVCWKKKMHKKSLWIFLLYIILLFTTLQEEQQKSPAVTMNKYVHTFWNALQISSPNDVGYPVANATEWNAS